MKLSKLYANKILRPIVFKDGINFILANDHSVGKTTLFKLIDYCLMKDKPSFLKNEGLVSQDLEFYLEVELDQNCFITIKRSLKPRTKNHIQYHTQKNSFIDLENEKFDFSGNDSDTLAELNKALNITLNKNLINIRHYLGYFLRDQDNQSDVFKLNKFLKSKDIDYKPIISNLLGINGNIIREKYLLENTNEDIDQEIRFLEGELGRETTKDAVEGKIKILQERKKDKEDRYNKFDFYLSEKNISLDLIKRIETDISKLNDIRNSLLREIAYINVAIEKEMSLDIEDIQNLFTEINVAFPDALKKNYTQVLNFNKQMAVDRKTILINNRKKFEKDLEKIAQELSNLNNQRSDALSVLKDTDTMSKFKKLEQEIIDIESDIKNLLTKINNFEKIESLKQKIEENKIIIKQIIASITIEIKNPFIEQFRDNIQYYSKIVFNEDALFTPGLNTHDNVNFEMDLASNGSFDNDKAEGHTIKKLLCFIFSAALLKSYRDTIFFKFIAFDSPFDGDKNIWQEGFYNALKDLESYGIQSIITTIKDEIKNKHILQEVQKNHCILELDADDRLIGDF